MNNHARVEIKRLQVAAWTSLPLLPRHSQRPPPPPPPQPRRFHDDHEDRAPLESDGRDVGNGRAGRGGRRFQRPDDRAGLQGEPFWSPLRKASRSLAKGPTLLRGPAFVAPRDRARGEIDRTGPKKSYLKVSASTQTQATVGRRD
uniref:Uncharacterized protein n=1 Tax=Trichuris muris TaxID=70415 RepID=A0A5S6R490_TRIMR